MAAGILLEDVVVSVDRLGKRFGRSPTRRRGGGAEDVLEPVGAADAGVGEGDDDDDDDDFGEAVDGEARVAVASASPSWAFRDVSFEVRRGQALGIIGPVGSGKTTLIRVLGRVTPPSEGRAVLRGRVAPQVQLASTFMRGDQTLRQNASLLSSFFGVPRAVVRRQLAAIFAFAELEGREEMRLDRVPKSMVSRLATSVVLHAESDIMLADDILAVGDSAFLERSTEFVTAAISGGLALVFASSRLELLETVCTHALWLDDGRMVSHGLVGDVLEEYRRQAGDLRARGRETEEPLGEAMQEGAEQEIPKSGKTSSSASSANADAAIMGHEFENDHGASITSMTPRDRARLRIVLDVFTPGISLRCGVAVSAGKGIGVRAVQPAPFKCGAAGRYAVTVILPAAVLGGGLHEVRIGAEVLRDGSIAEIIVPRAKELDVVGAPLASQGGQTRLRELENATWTVESLGASDLDSALT